MGRVSDALASGKPMDIVNALIWDMNDEEHDKESEFRDIKHDRDAYGNFIELSGYWLRYLTDYYKTNKRSVDGKGISHKQYKDAVKAANNPVIKIFFNGHSSSSFHENAENCVKMIAELPPDAQSKWTRYAMNGCMAIGNMLRGR